MLSKEIERCYKKYLSMSNRHRKLIEKAYKRNDESIKQEASLLFNEIQNFTNGEYSKTVFDYCVKNNVKIQDVYSKEIDYFINLFGTSFEALTKLQKTAIVGIVENGGRYILI